MIEDLQKMLKEIPEQRSLILDKLVEFSLTDMMLFWGQNKELVAQQEKIWGPLLQWVEQEFDTKLKTTQNLDVPEQDQKLVYRLNFELQKLSDRQLVAFYAMAFRTRSVLLALAFVKGKINAQEAFQAAALEEIWQAEKWGKDEEAESRRQTMRQELEEIQDFLYHE